MAFEARLGDGELVIVLRGVDRVLCWRGEVRVDLDAVTSTGRQDREVLESRLDSRVYGRGTNRGERGRGRARVGAFLGRDVHGGRQIWAVSRAATSVVVLDLDRGPFRRFVIGEAACPPELAEHRHP